jgi:uncharacterized protein
MHAGRYNNRMWTIFLLVGSNIFMTFAWYGHLKWFRGDAHSMLFIVLFSWAIAFFEYCLMVPANRLGKDIYGFSTAELKTMQEIITLVIFAIFTIIFLKEKLAWNHIAGFVCIAAAGFFVFNPWFKSAALTEPHTPALNHTADNQTNESAN